MRRYIDADALINKLDERCDAICQWTKKEREVMCGACPLATAFDEVEEFPTADVVEVIPCKDCFYAKPYNKKWRLPINENRLWCEHHNEEKEPNWFCADAVRRKQ